METTRLFAYLPSAPETHDALLRERVTPFVSGLARHPSLTSVSFTRSSEPEALIRVMAHGGRDWMEKDVRPAMNERFGSIARDDLRPSGAQLARLRAR